MSGYENIERARWHLRRSLAMPEPSWPYTSQQRRHHHRCFVLLCCREHDQCEFDRLRKERFGLA